MREIATVLLAIMFVALHSVGEPRAAEAVAPLVDAAWIAKNHDRSGLTVLDIRNEIDGGSAATYREGHIPGAVYSNYLEAGWRTEVDGVPGLLPPVEMLEPLIGSLGIGNDTRVVIVAGGVGSTDMASATRVYWTFKAMGHDAVSILDGGYRGYIAEVANPVERGWNAPEAKTFAARPRPELVAGLEDVRAAVEKKTPLIDVRPAVQYLGQETSPVAKRAGTIPGAVNIPHSELVTQTGYFVGAERVRQLLKKAGVPPSGATITFCNTGHWGSLGWFALSEILGNADTRLYDGSIAEWSTREELPMELKGK